MQRDRCDRDPARDERRQERVRKRAGGARHLGAARVRGEHNLAFGQRPLARDVAVADRGAVAGQEVRGRPPAGVDIGQPQARPREVGREQGDARPVGKRRPLAGAAAAEALAARAQLDDRARAVQRGKGIERCMRRAFRRPRVAERPGGQRGGRVDDDQIAGTQVRREIASAGVRIPSAVATSMRTVARARPRASGGSSARAARRRRPRRWWRAAPRQPGAGTPGRKF